MSRSTRIRMQDARALLRLAGELAELPRDPAIRGQHLVDELCRLLGAQCGMVAVLTSPGGRPPLTMVYGVEGGEIDAAARRVYLDYVRRTHTTDPLLDALHSGGGQPHTVLRREFIDDRAWYASEFVNEVKFLVGVDDAVYAFHPLPAPGYHIGLGINRPRRARFTRREKLLLDLISSELGWLYRQFASQAREGQTTLPPRLQSVLVALLKGGSEKQIARQMGLSYHTLHDYVKELYRRTGISSRAELMARYADQS